MKGHLTKRNTAHQKLESPTLNHATSYLSVRKYISNIHLISEQFLYILYVFNFCFLTCICMCLCVSLCLCVYVHAMEIRGQSVGGGFLRLLCGF